METIGPSMIGAPISVKTLHIYPLSGTISLKHLSIGNPKGFHAPHAMELDRLKVSVKLSSLLSDTMVIKEILIDGPDITYERKLTTDNIATIRKNIRRYFDKPSHDGEENTSTPSVPSKARKDRHLAIQHLVLQNGQVNVQLSNLGSVSAHLPKIDQTNIGTQSGGAAVDRAIDQVFAILDNAIVDVVAHAGGKSNHILEDAGGAAKEIGDTATDAIKSIGNLLKKR